VELFLERDYRIFGALAGVRNKTMRVYSARGLPEDCWAAARSNITSVLSNLGKRPILPEMNT
jgi:hypothetical protein